MVLRITAELCCVPAGTWGLCDRTDSRGGLTPAPDTRLLKCLCGWGWSEALLSRGGLGPSGSESREPNMRVKCLQASPLTVLQLAALHLDSGVWKALCAAETVLQI